MLVFNVKSTALFDFSLPLLDCHFACANRSYYILSFTIINHDNAHLLECCTDELRRTQLALASIQRQQQMCQSVESELNTSHQSVTEHQQQATDRVATLDMLSQLPTRKLK